MQHPLLRTLTWILATGFVLALTPLAVNAQLDRIELYSDEALSECALADASRGIGDVYAVHHIEDPVGARALYFRLVSSPGFSGTWLEDIVRAPAWATIGTSQTGFAIQYPSPCPTTSILVLQARYQLFGTSSPCSFVEAVPWNGICCIVTLSCWTTAEYPVDGDRIHVNLDASCPCGVPVATEPTTWGRVKALYR
jgi:hypothetical protein